MSPLSATLTAAVLAFGGAPPMARHAALGSGRQTCAAQSVRMLGDREARTALKRELGVPNHPQLAAIATRRDAKKKESTGQRLVDVRIEGMSESDMVKYKSVAGFIGVMLVNRLAQGFGRAKPKPGAAEAKSSRYTALDDGAKAELKAFKCENCGYELYPARGREGKFFPDTFKCPMCKSPKESFYDMNDANDPRNWEEDDENGADAE